MWKIGILLLVIIISAGCGSFSSNNTFEQPQGKVRVNGKDFRMIVNEFEWQENDFEFRKINSSGSESVEEFDTLQVEKEQKLKIKIEQSPSYVTINQSSEDKSNEVIELQNNEFTLPKEEGYYIYEVIAEWDNGIAIYMFDVNIE